MVLACTRKRAPVFDPVAKLGVSDGGNQFQGLLAVELFAVAPESFKRRESNTIERKSRQRRVPLCSDCPLKRFLFVLIIVLKAAGNGCPDWNSGCQASAKVLGLSVKSSRFVGQKFSPDNGLSVKSSRL